MTLALAFVLSLNAPNYIKYKSLKAVSCAFDFIAFNGLEASLYKIIIRFCGLQVPEHLLDRLSATGFNTEKFVCLAKSVISGKVDREGSED
jgi:hypothetical protein